MDLFEEAATGLVNGPGDELGSHVLHVAKRKGMSRRSYDMYLPLPPLSTVMGVNSAAAYPGVLVGRVVPNAVGSVFSILQRTDLLTDNATAAVYHQDEARMQWQEVCAVQYEVNILGRKGPRKMNVVIHAVDNTGAPTSSTAAIDEGGPLMERFRCGLDTDPDIVPLCNKPPVWCTDTRSFILDFGGRVTVSSVKSFQLMHPTDKDYVVMQFGKVGQDSFTLDIRFPMSPVMALGVAVTSLDRKLACH
ncbi:hypothetical protein GGI04_002979 [Coemansia thaxteri]|uniref:Tubby C-terminal domain-containing protein n=1 Tax=Coemansia thaxteri TaxID=2663907 RepID=A0A9W8BIL9_9FUNG|nr:hypothetical protein H4R26_003169 [Coemansia thaxteri]KAJ2003405.1 hypothetical protein GGI04_002979 [Coemansia thaxteri]